MAISGKDVQVWMWRVVKFSMRCAYTLIKNHPFVSCPVLFFLLLYTCFPSIFWISIYSSAFLILAVSVTKIYLSLQNAKSFKRGEKISNAESIRKDDFAKNDAYNNRNEKRFGRARSVRRRKPCETSRDSSVHTSEDEKNTVFSSTFNNDMVDKSALTEERPKEIREIEVDSVISNASSVVSSGLRPEFHETFYGRSRKFGGGDMEIESSEGTDEEDEQEREANNKAVQWTETDQKNLTDLGLSEIERNKRLESLIARRRARKMLSLQVRRSVLKMDYPENSGLMTSLAIPRNNNSFLDSQPTGNFSPMPGSAPSVLLPNYNPFDLPYDAQEEKPILTGGSFQLEFKDMTFIRPESVVSGASIPGELKEDQQESSLPSDSSKIGGVQEGLQDSEVKGQIDERDTTKIIEVESCQSPNSKLNTVAANIVIKEEISDSEGEADLVSNCKEENSSEVQTKSVLIEDSLDKLSSASSSEEDVPHYKVDKDAVLRSLASPLLRNMSRNREESSQMGNVENNYDLSVFNKNKMQEHFYHADKAMHHSNHTPMSSIASDLQVEVSEVSSPEIIDNGSILFPDEEFSAYKENMENESTTGAEGIREKSSQLPRKDENESKEVYNTNRDITVEVGFSRTKESENDVPHELSEAGIGNDATDSISKFASKAELPNRNEDHSSSFHSNIKDNFQSSLSDLSRTLASDNSAFPVMHKLQQLKGDPMGNISQDDDSEKPKQPSYPSLKSKGELSTICDDDSKILQNNDEEFNIRGTDDIVDLLIEQGRREPTELSQTSSPNSVDYTGKQPDKTEEHHSILELVGKNVDAKVFEDIEGDVKDTKQDKMDDSMAIRGNDTLESIQVDDGEQNRVELRASGVHPHFSDHQVGPLQPELALEQSHIASSASSPTSVLQPSISLDPISLPSFNDDTDIEIHQFHPQRVENSMFGEARGEGLTSPQSTMLLMVDSSSPPSHEESAETSKESFNHSTSTKEANSTGSVREDMVHKNENKQNETSYIEGSSGRRGPFNLSLSTEEENSTESVSKDKVNENERRQNISNCMPEGSGRQESPNPSRSTSEENETGSLSQDMVHENERRQNKTNYIPEGSSERLETSNLVTSEQDNSVGAVSQKLIHENEMRPNETMVVPEGSSRRLSSHVSAAALSNLLKEINPDLPDVGQEYSNLLTSIKEANDIGSMSKHVIHEDEKKQNESKDSPEVSSNSLSCYDSEALSKTIEETSSCLPVLAPNEETNSKGTVSEQVIPERERRQNETKDISEGSLERLSPEPTTVALSKGIGEFSADLTHTVQESANLSASSVEANSMRFANECIIHENEKTQTEAKDIPGGSSPGLRSPDATTALSENTEQISSRSLTRTDDSYEELQKHEAKNEALPALLNPIEQAIKLNNPIFNREITMNAPAGSSIEGALHGNPYTEKSIVNQKDGPSKDEIVEEAPKV